MAFSNTMVKNGVMGDLKYEIHTLTDVQNAGSTMTPSEIKNIYAAFPHNQTALTSDMMVTWSGTTITITTTTNDDDGFIMIFGK